MEVHEGIDKMQCRFNDIVKNLKAFDKEYSLDEKNRKILSALSFSEKLRPQPQKKLII